MKQRVEGEGDTADAIRMREGKTDLSQMADISELVADLRMFGVVPNDFPTNLSTARGFGFGFDD